MNTNVREIRTALGISQAKLAAILHVHSMTVSNWESGRQGMDIENARKLAHHATYAGVPTTLDDIYGMPKRGEMPARKPIKKAAAKKK